MEKYKLKKRADALFAYLYINIASLLPTCYRGLTGAEIAETVLRHLHLIARAAFEGHIKIYLPGVYISENF